MTPVSASTLIGKGLAPASSRILSTVFHRWEEVARFRTEWNELVRHSYANEVFSTFDWLEAWSSGETRTAAPHIVVLFEGGTVVAVAPLMKASRKVFGVGLRTLEFIGTPNSDYSDFIYADEALLPKLWSAVVASSEEVDLIYLPQIKETSPTWRYLETRPGVKASL